MNQNLELINQKVFKTCDLKLSDIKIEPEGKEYDACNFKLNQSKVFSRSSKITPKKVGQFVTFWRRNKEGITEPHHEMNSFDFLIINAKTENNFGQFVFPKSVLIKKGIISTDKKEGKRGFRVYPNWDIPTSKQAISTQKWQTKYFYEINNEIDFEKVKELYTNK
ncbi:MepB family protein [Aureivirga sp. CE67]|uniref:MepB family protein n=1 Tax=Aureivirga sp. CE67 TaxID=1788983 RepID=UPI0018CA6E35|nr:MepB family protein [Aureivirga sp. CE67]